MRKLFPDGSLVSCIQICRDETTTVGYGPIGSTA